MSNALLSSKVIVTKAPPKIRTLTAQPTAILAMLGISSWGPVGEANLYTSFDEWRRVHGPVTAESADTYNAVQGFFDEGGQYLYFGRVVHYSDIESGTTAAAKATATLQSDTPADTLQVDGKYEGARGDDIEVEITDATSGVTDEFNLLVYEDGELVETWANLTMDDTADRYAETIVNHAKSGSDYITVTDLDEDPDPAVARPANVAATSLSGGDDGLTDLDDNDFSGTESSGLGIHMFNDVEVKPTLICCPARPTSVVQNALITWCEGKMDSLCFALLDSPEGESYSDIVTYVNSTASLSGLSEVAAIAWPWVKAVNPNKTVLGDTDTVTCPPSGHWAGMISRVDSARPGGLYDQPGGPENGRLRTIVGVETQDVFDEKKRDFVFPHRINIIDKEGGVWNMDGVRTLKGDGNFPSIGESRTAIFISKQIKAGLQFARQRNNTPELRAEASRFAEAFLLAQMKLGAFRSKIPEQAFQVDFGRGINTDDVIFSGLMKGRIGLATNKPAEYIWVELSQDTRAYEQALNG